jgi:hypothetical protein
MSCIEQWACNEENVLSPPRPLLMSETKPKSATTAEDDLSFPPPLTEHAQYLVLANEFLAQDQATQEIVGADSDHKPDKKGRPRTRIVDEAA